VTDSALAVFEISSGDCWSASIGLGLGSFSSHSVVFFLNLIVTFSFSVIDNSWTKFKISVHFLLNPFDP